jgi:prepilin-type N-terminal cleavage/methylation domain-containing protein
MAMISDDIRRCSGMTLIELVVVLALLAGLAALSMSSLGDFGQRARYDETGTRLGLIRSAVVGDGVESGRFLRDLGRLPILHSDADGQRLEELWLDRAGIGYGATTNDLTWPGGIAVPFPYDAVIMSSGWNGPYLIVDDPAAARSYDGFGHPWQVETNAYGEITAIASLGADGAAGGGDWADEDRRIDLAGLIPATELTVLVKGRVSTNAQEGVWRMVEDVGGDPAPKPYQLDRLVVAVFQPGCDDRQRALGRRTNDWSLVSGRIEFDGLLPTDCLIYAYATNSVAGVQVSASEPEPLRLHPGRNMYTIHLRE